MTPSGWWLLGSGLLLLAVLLAVLTLRVSLGRYRTDPIGKQWNGMDNTAEGLVASFRRDCYTEPAWRWLPLYRALYAFLLVVFAGFMLQLFYKVVQ